MFEVRRALQRLFRKMRPIGYSRHEPAWSDAKPNYQVHGYRSTRTLVSLIALVSILVVAVWWLLPRTQNEALLLERLRLAMERSDHNQARNHIEALLTISADEAAYRWWCASVDQQLGDVEHAAVLRTQLAWDGYGPAVQWLLDRDFRIEESRQWSRQQHEQFQSLMTAKTRETGNIEVILTQKLAAYWAMQGDVEQAVSALRSIVSLHPAAYVNIASLHLQAGDHSQAEANAKLAITSLERTLETQPQDIQSRLELIRALIIVSRESEALVVASQGFDLTGQPVMQQAAGEALVSWSRRLERTEGIENTFWPRLQLIHRASQCAPHDSLVLNAIIDLTNECQSMETERVPALREATARGIQRIAAHTMIAWIKAFALDAQNSLRHLQLVIPESPELPTVMNNLALTLLERTDATDEQALVTISLALELLPGQPEFLDTRARILTAQLRSHARDQE